MEFRGDNKKAPWPGGQGAKCSTILPSSFLPIYQYLPLHQVSGATQSTPGGWCFPVAGLQNFPPALLELLPGVVSPPPSVLQYVLVIWQG